MRLEIYLNEESKAIFKDYSKENIDKIINTLHKDCKIYIKLIKSSKNIAKRTEFSGGSESLFRKGYIRKDRKPTDMSIEGQKKFDELFQRKFNWKVRSAGSYTYIHDLYNVSDFDNSNAYYFPIGKFDYIWSPHIQDLFYGDSNDEDGDTENLTYDYEKIVNGFIMNKGFERVVNQEVVWRCKSYYLLNLYGIKETKEIIKRIIDI